MSLVLMTSISIPVNIEATASISTLTLLVNVFHENAQYG